MRDASDCGWSGIRCGCDGDRSGGGSVPWGVIGDTLPESGFAGRIGVVMRGLGAVECDDCWGGELGVCWGGELGVF